MAFVLREPHNARSRPTAHIKNDSHYEKLFSNGHALDLYLKSAEGILRLDNYIRSDSFQLGWAVGANYKYHVASLVSIKLLKQKKFSPDNFSKIDLHKMTDVLLNECYIESINLIGEYAKVNQMDQQTALKSKDALDDMLKKFVV